MAFRRKANDAFTEFFGDGTGELQLPTGPAGRPSELSYEDRGNRGWRRGGDRGDGERKGREEEDPNAGRSDDVNNWRSGGSRRRQQEEDPNAGRSDGVNTWRSGGSGGRARRQQGGYGSNRWGRSSRFGDGGGSSRFGDYGKRNDRYGNDDRGYGESSRSSGYRPLKLKSRGTSGIAVMNVDESSEETSESSSSEDEKPQRKRRGRKGKKGKDTKHSAKPIVRRFEAALKKDVLKKEELVRCTLLKAMDEKTPIDIKDLKAGLCEVKIEEDDVKIDFVRVVSLSLCEEKISFDETFTLLKDAYKEHVQVLVTDLMSSLKSKKGVQDLKNFLTKEQKMEVFTMITKEIDDDKEAETFLVDKDLLFLLPIPDLTDYIEKNISSEQPKDILEHINKEVAPQVSISELGVPIANYVFGKIFKNKDELNVNVLEKYSELLQRVIVKPVDHQAQGMVLYEAQGAWVASKSAKGLIKEIFIKLHELEIISPAGFVFWRDDRTIKSKKKSKVLLSVNSWIAEIAPKIVVEASDSDEDDGDEGDFEQDEYLQNPNQAFFK